MNSKYSLSLSAAVLALLANSPSGAIAQQGSNLETHTKPAVTTTSSDPNTVNYTTSWIGNTLGGKGNGATKSLNHIPIDVDGLYVTPDGKVYTNTTWDEGGRPVSVFQHGQLISPLNDENNSPNYQNGGGDAVAADQNYIYKGNTAGGTNGGQGVSVLNAADLTPASVSFTGSSTLGKSYAVNGIAIANGQIYITEEDMNVVDVFNQSTLQLVTSLSISNPAHIAVDAQGGLWISHDDTAPYPNLNGIAYDYNHDYGLSQIDHYDGTGKWINGIALPDDSEISALWIDNYGNLLVGDEGPDQNIKVYTNLANNPTLAKTIGELGGTLAGDTNTRGTVGPWRFRGITGIGTDNANNLYISQNGWGFQHGNGHGVQIQSYNTLGKLNWSVEGLEYAHTLDLDPRTQTDIYDPYHHFKADFTKPAGKDTTYVADTLDRFRYPDDVRITNIASVAQIRYIGSHKFLVVSNQLGAFFAIYRFDESATGPGKEIAIPCAAFDYGSFQGQYKDFNVQPLDGEFIWRDLNGDGRIDPNEFLEPANNLHRDGNHFWMDSQGDVWQTNYQGENPPYENSIHIRRYLFQGFDSFGAPIYDFDHVVVYTAATDFPELGSVNAEQFIPDSTGGVLYISGGNASVGAFSQIARYDHWDQGNRKAKFLINVPFDPDPNNFWNPNSFSQAGKFIFVDFNVPHYTLIYSAEDGSYVGKFTPGEDVGGLKNVGNDDEWQSTSARVLRNGEYLLFKEEDYQAKQLLFEWTPPTTLTKIPPPAPPTDVAAVANDEAVTLSWAGGAGALVYTVSRSTTKGGPYTAVDTGVVGETVPDLGLTNGTTYYYVVSSLSETGTSINSPELAATPISYGTTYEAENAVLNGANVYPCPLCSGGALVGYLIPGNTMTFTVTVAKTGTYAVRIYDCNGDGTTPPIDTIGVVVNGGSQEYSPVLPFTGNGYATPGYVTMNLPLNVGSNTIVLGNPASDPNGAPNIDRIVIPTNPK